MKEKYPRGMIVVQGLVMIVVSTVISLILISPIYLFEIPVELLVLIFTFPIDLIPLPFNWLGLILFPVGLLIVTWPNYTLLHIGKIGLRDREPMQRPSNLIVVGPYKFTRTPIYLGGILMLFALVIVWSSLIVFLGSVFVYAIFRYVFIKREEVILEEEFGDDYLAFKKRIRRWI
ncbi:MAG: isoprenylcysteine carboxylmethyltransferase family protein [Candidatus Thorarchaeota archaeon]|nr:isoprenylcysteine carboxylmethyltransferase family protein [Candidatus Thorarchaeota archaeon]